MIPSSVTLAVECDAECPCQTCQRGTCADGCGFEGEVDARPERGRLVWECPWCSTVHEDDTGDHLSPDPDEAYERQRDEDVAS